MKATIMKRFTFEASHQLPNHEGQCHSLHGHSYKLEVYARGEIKSITDEEGDLNHDPEQGMVVDFGRISQVVKTQIMPLVDHKHLNDRFLVPTAELVAVWILEVLSQYNMSVFKVRLWETETCYAEVQL